MKNSAEKSAAKTTKTKPAAKLSKAKFASKKSAAKACREKETDSRAITFAEQKKILQTIDNPKYRKFFFFCCATGVRSCEALRIKTADIDKTNKLIKIKMRDTKTKKHRRDIPFVSGLFKDFDLSGKYLFNDITDDGSRQYFCTLYKDMNLDLSRHSARHTFISVCAHLKIAPEQIQQWAGHTDLKMTTDTYTHTLACGSSPILSYLKKLKKSLKL